MIPLHRHSITSAAASVSKGLVEPCITQQEGPDLYYAHLPYVCDANTRVCMRAMAHRSRSAAAVRMLSDDSACPPAPLSLYRPKMCGQLHSCVQFATHQTMLNTTRPEDDLR